MAELCFNQTCVFNPLDNVSFTSWGFICPHDKLLHVYMYMYLGTHWTLVHVSRHTLDIHKHESGNPFKIVDCNENLPYANPLKRKLLEMHKIPP